MEYKIMKIQQTIKSFFAIGAILIGLTAAAFGQTEPPEQRLRIASFGLQTVEAGRTARLSVIHQMLPGRARRRASRSILGQSRF